MPDIHSILFDLDGTLVDTAPDLGLSLNTLLIEEGREPLPMETIRPEASHGAMALIKAGFDITPDDPGFDRLKKRFLDIYADNICEHSQLIRGMDIVVERLEANKLDWGIVTNKPGYLTEPLLMQLGLDTRAKCIVSGDTTPFRKPHPAPLVFACKEIGSDTRHCLYVGDAERDIRAGREAGLQTLVALFGYIRKNETPKDWGADGMVTHPGKILDWLDIG